MLLKCLTNLKVKALTAPLIPKGVTNTNFAPSHQITSKMLGHLAAPCSTLIVHRIQIKKNGENWFRFGQVKYNAIYAFGENNGSGIRSRQVPVWRGLISRPMSVINSGPNNYYGIDRIPVWAGSGM